MKSLKLLLLFVTISTFSQNEEIKFTFESKFFEGTDKWVAFPKSDADNTFIYGIIYIDQMAGFTFEYVGDFKIENNKFINLNPEKTRTNSIKQRLQGNTRNVQILTDKQVEKLELGSTSKWIEVYKRNENSEKYKIDIASFYNGVGGSEIALNILKEIYNEKSKDKKLLFELSFAHNALGNFEDSKTVLKNAINQHPDYELYYKELLYAEMNLKNIEQAEQTYTEYIKSSTERIYQVEMAYNLTYTFFAAKNKDKFKEWSSIVNDNADKNSVFAKNIKAMQAELDKL